MTDNSGRPTDTNRDRYRTIRRRDVLKTMGLGAGLSAVGMGAWSTPVRASSHLSYEFYALDPVFNVQRVVGFNSSDATGDSIPATVVANLGANSDNPTEFDAYTTAFHPDGLLYGISNGWTSNNSEANRLFTIDLQNNVLDVLSTNSVFTPDERSVPGSAFGYAGGELYYYFVKSGDDELVRVDPDGGNPMTSDLVLGASYDDAEGDSLTDYYGEYNFGLGIDYDPTDSRFVALITSIEETPQPDAQDDIIEIFPDGTVEFLREDAVSEEFVERVGTGKVGDEYSPCDGTVTGIRGGSTLFQASETEGEPAEELGDVQLSGTNIDVASLATPWPDCLPCETFPLCAGQDTDVGSITVVENGDGTLNITYEVDEPWLIYETHAHVGCTKDDFPLAGRGNPQVGRFDESKTHEGVSSYTYEDVEIPECEEGIDDILVATHAVVYETDCGTEAEPFSWATEVTESDLGTRKNGDPIASDRTIADNALGAPDGSFLSLGFPDDDGPGYVVVAFENPVLNGPGDDDIVVAEVTNGRGSYPEENADVYVRPVGESDFVYAGTVSNNDNFDGNSPGVGSVAIPDGIVAVDAVKIVDASDASPHDSSADAFDVNAVGANCLTPRNETAWTCPGAEDVKDFVDSDRGKGSWATYFQYTPCE